MDKDRVQFLKGVVPSHLVPLLTGVNTQTSASSVQSLALANDVANLSNEHVGLTKALLADNNINSTRDIARRYNTQKLTKLAASGDKVPLNPAKIQNSSDVGGTKPVIHLLLRHSSKSCS